MTETLFGGILFSAAMFFSIRKLGLSNFWAGIFSGLLPFIVYLYYSTKFWSGGDVLAIHFAVYLANAGLLIVFGGMQKNKQKLHWAPRMIVIFFISLVVLNAVFLSLSTRGLPDQLAKSWLPNPEQGNLHTGFPGVIPHDKNKSYEPQLQQIDEQKSLGWEVKILGLKEIKPKQPTTLSIQLIGKDKQAVTDANITLALWRMANSRDDQALVFKEVSPGQYQVSCTLPAEGRWLTHLQISRGNDRYTSKQSLFVDGD
jgi:nitrogen fixation protein FixH